MRATGPDDERELNPDPPHDRSRRASDSAAPGWLGSQEPSTRRRTGVDASPAPIAFDRVVAEHGPAVLRACRSLVGADACEDLWSETFMSALRSYDGSAPPENTLAWLLAITRRRSVDHWRAAGRRPDTVSGPADIESGAVEHRLADTDDQLLDLLRDLPPKQRAAVAYRYLADLDYEAIGALIGSSPAAARRSAADGVAKLRAALDDGGDGP